MTRPSPSIDRDDAVADPLPRCGGCGARLRDLNERVLQHADRGGDRLTRRVALDAAATAERGVPLAEIAAELRLDVRTLLDGEETVA